MTPADPPAEHRWRRSARIAIAVAFLALAAFWAWSRRPLVVEGMWRDEAAAIYVARSPSVSEFLARHKATEYTPPLFNSLLALYGRCFGFEELTLKFFALGLGFLAMVAVTALAKELFGGLAALITCVMAVNNPILIGLSAELRPYSLSIALAALSLIFVSRLRNRQVLDASAPWLAARVALCSAFLAYSHIGGALVVLAIGLVGALALLRPDSRGFGRKTLAASAIAGGFFAFWLPAAWSHFRAGLPYERRFGVAARWNALAERMHLVLPDVAWWLFLLAAAGIIFGAARGWKVFKERLRSRAFDFGIVAAASLAVLLPLGLFSQTNRYLAIPAAFSAVVAGGLLAEAFRAAAAAGRNVGLVSGLAVAAFLTGSFLTGAPLYSNLQREARQGVPKSGIRTLCHERSLEGPELLIANPDYLATTLWYYCGREPEIRGVVLWRNALLLDWREYGRLWASARGATQETELLERRIAVDVPRRILLVSDAMPALGSPLGFPARIRALRLGLASRYVSIREGAYRGRIEQVEVGEFRVDRR